MTIAEHAEAVARCTQALRYLEQHPSTTRRQLGIAREHLNRAYALPEDQIWDTVFELEGLVAFVYGGCPN